MTMVSQERRDAWCLSRHEGTSGDIGDMKVFKAWERETENGPQRPRKTDPKGPEKRTPKAPKNGPQRPHKSEHVFFFSQICDVVKFTQAAMRSLKMSGCQWKEKERQRQCNESISVSIVLCCFLMVSSNFQDGDTEFVELSWNMMKYETSTEPANVNLSLESRGSCQPTFAPST